MDITQGEHHGRQPACGVRGVSRLWLLDRLRAVGATARAGHGVRDPAADHVIDLIAARTDGRAREAFAPRTRANRAVACGALLRLAWMSV
jgi:hypothetical protein